MENQEAHFISISTIASQLMDDVQSIYGVRRRTLMCGKGRSAAISKIPNSGELVVVASRDSDHRQNLILWLSRWGALESKQVVAIYSSRKSFVRFARELVGDLSDISAETDIYAGGLGDSEVERLTYELNRVIQSEIYVHSASRRGIENILESARSLNQKTGGIGLLIVDALQYMTVNPSKFTDTLHSLICLKSLAEQIAAPVVALYHLDPEIEGHCSTLTRNELHEIEELSEMTDGLMLMSMSQDKIAFAVPKIPNAKPVKWLV